MPDTSQPLREALREAIEEALDLMYASESTKEVEARIAALIDQIPLVLEARQADDT